MTNEDAEGWSTVGFRATHFLFVSVLRLSMLYQDRPVISNHSPICDA